MFDAAINTLSQNYSTQKALFKLVNSMSQCYLILLSMAPLQYHNYLNCNF